MEPASNENFTTNEPAQTGKSMSSKSTAEAKIRFNKNCIVLALIRLLIVVFQFGGWVSAAAIPKPYYGVHYLPPEFDLTRSAYLFFSVVGFAVAIVFFVLMILNIVNVGIFARVPWVMALLVTDALWVIPTLVLAIVCCIRESTVQSAYYLNVVINQGAFGSASAFGFLSTIMYVVGGLVETLMILKNGIDCQIPSA